MTNETNRKDSAVTTPSTTEDDIWLSADKVCEWLDVNKDWVYDMVESRSIPHVKLGRQLRFNKGELRTWLEGQRRA